MNERQPRRGTERAASPGRVRSAQAASDGSSGDWRGRLPFFYGWLIVAGSMLALGFTYSIMYSFSVFYVALLEEFGWGRAETAGIYSAFMIVTGIGALGAGVAADRFGPGRVIACGGVWLAIGLFACSRVSALWQFYLSFGVVVALGVSMAGWTPCVTIINRWFSVRLGLALGIASAGIGVGIMAVVPAVQLMIGSLGWRTAYVALAGFVFLGLLPVGLIVLRGRPEDLGQVPDGIEPETVRPKRPGRPRARRELEIVDRAWAEREWTLGAAARTPRLWLLAALKLLGGIATQMIFVHQVVYLVDSGYDRMLAASVVGLIGLLSVGAKVFWGWAADNIGREMTYTLGCAAMVVAVGLLGLTRVVPFPGMVYLYAVMFAIGYAVSAPLWPVVTADLFAGKNFGAIYGLVTVFNGFGNALGAWLGGYVFDVTGSYAFAFGAAVVAKAFSAGALWIVAPGKVRRVRRAASH
ncbi:MAG: MFS transporter [Betaproteobacteria bacterium]|nr:MAG: MFS transporter [Betaproteobacteria bacterium]